MRIDSNKINDFIEGTFFYSKYGAIYVVLCLGALSLLFGGIIGGYLFEVSEREAGKKDTVYWWDEPTFKEQRGEELTLDTYYTVAPGEAFTYDGNGSNWVDLKEVTYDDAGASLEIVGGKGISVSLSEGNTLTISLDDDKPKELNVFNGTTDSQTLTFGEEAEIVETSEIHGISESGELIVVGYYRVYRDTAVLDWLYKD